MPMNAFESCTKAIMWSAQRCAGFCISIMLLSPRARPGHHAERGEGAGFCIFNNVAVAAAAAREVYGLKRICIVDYDVHHGNGTQGGVWPEAHLHCGLRCAPRQWHTGSPCNVHSM
eukprot:1161755-Pelagomonas_calceolata.AAC.1